MSKTVKPFFELSIDEHMNLTDQEMKESVRAQLQKDRGKEIPDEVVNGVLNKYQQG